MTSTSTERGHSLLRISGSVPSLLADADPARLTRISRAERTASQDISRLVQRSFMPWSIIAYAVPAWARKVFPDLPEDEAVSRLWDAVFAAIRADQARSEEHTSE